MADDTAALEREAAEMQAAIDSGVCWHMEGSVGRAAMDMIENGLCVLGPEPHFDYWNNLVPSRTMVKAGTKGSVKYANRLRKQMGLKRLVFRKKPDAVKKGAI